MQRQNSGALVGSTPTRGHIHHRCQPIFLHKVKSKTRPRPAVNIAPSSVRGIVYQYNYFKQVLQKLRCANLNTSIMPPSCASSFLTSSGVVEAKVTAENIHR